ncbi:ABC-type antimicrobial peptide transport system permease subunit [Dysgonomonas hofstadii]|uniref:ABC-type antimicrobial peptide transport system permease subunit n=1 Tax=Dysgonomonas hofstadii TaxID=637886 RepID=A0A840CSG6_9BACT|nr:hypothetical protein [Dysgonomonas hofstadii]MBB4037619.1 ABC-type antimicrobial peptide transport system permease subunit [Dysgonomonas hofstadii]
MKKYIDDNRRLFDDKEPSDGHMERFEAMLSQLDEKKEEKKPAKKVRLVSLISVAASIAVLIAIAVKFYAPDSINVTAPTQESISTSEFQATNEFYNQQMEEQIADIMCKLAQTDPQNQAQLTSDLQQIIEQNQAFVEQMGKKDDQEIAIRYLVKHYKANIQALRNINEKLGKHTHC